MNTKNTETRADRLKEEVLSDLNHVDQDLRRVEARLTPGQLIDDAIFYRRGHDPLSIFNHLKENPFGTSFLALGTLLLMDDRDHRSFERTTRDRLSSFSRSAKVRTDHLREKVEDLKTNFSMGASDLRGRAYDFIDDNKERVEHLRERLTRTKEALQEKLPSREEAKGDLEDLKAAAGDSLGQAKENLQDFKESVGESFDGIKEKIEDMETPWTFMTLGAALGAMSGAVLPELPKEEMILESEKLKGFSADFRVALDEAVNAVKTEFLTDLKNMNVQLFQRPS